MRKPLLAMIAVSLAGCMANSSVPNSTPEQVETPPSYQNVQNLDEYMVTVSPGSLETTLSKLAAETGLKLRYDAELFFHNNQGAKRGSPQSIAQEIAGTLPLRVYVLGKELAVEQRWQIYPGQSLKTQIERWDKKSRWQVVWHTRKNQLPLASADFYGSFDYAVEALFRSLRNVGSELEPEFFPNNTVVVR